MHYNCIQVYNIKYLVPLLDELATFDKAISVSSDSAGKALGDVVDIYKHTRDTGYKTYTKLHDCGICRILHYAGEFGGLKTKVPHVTKFKTAYYVFSRG